MAQRLGTEWGRGLREDFWLLAWKARADLLGSFSFIVVDDIRFQNEADLIRSLGGEVWRIERPGVVGTAHGAHSSETLIDSLDVDHTILNEKSVSSLVEVALQLEGRYYRRTSNDLKSDLLLTVD